MFILLTSDLGLAGVVLAERTATLREEALSFEVLFAAGAVEALTVVVVVQRLHPLVAGLDGESAGEALGREQLVPVGLAVRVTLLQEERAVAELLAAVGALEALRVELLADGVEAVALHAGVALAADRGQELLEAVLAVQVTLLLDEADVGQRALAVAVVADEVIRAPDATQSGDEWSSDLLTAAATQWDTTARGNGLVHDATAAGRRGRLACRAALVERCGTCARNRWSVRILEMTVGTAVEGDVTEANRAVVDGVGVRVVVNGRPTSIGESDLLLLLLLCSSRRRSGSWDCLLHRGNRCHGRLLVVRVRRDGWKLGWPRLNWFRFLPLCF